jgi:hypothetical protein
MCGRRGEHECAAVSTCMQRACKSAVAPG